MTYPTAMTLLLTRQLDAAQVELYVTSSRCEEVVLSRRVRALEAQIRDWRSRDRKVCS